MLYLNQGNCEGIYIHSLSAALFTIFYSAVVGFKVARPVTVETTFATSFLCSRIRYRLAGEFIVR